MAYLGSAAAGPEIQLAINDNATPDPGSQRKHYQVFYPLPGTPLAHTVAGPPDPKTLRFLETLTLQKYETGRWKARLKTVDAMQMLPVTG